MPHCDRAEYAAAAAHLLHDQYWNLDRFTPADLLTAHRRSSAWVGARDARGHLVASARAVSDGVKHAWVYDVVVAPALRGSGVGAAVMRLLLDHPAVRGAAQVHLGTRDAQGFYARLGFVGADAMPPRPYASTHMIRAR